MSDDVLDAFLTRGLAAQKAVDELDVLQLVERARNLLLTAAERNRDPLLKVTLESQASELTGALRYLRRRP